MLKRSYTDCERNVVDYKSKYDQTLDETRLILNIFPNQTRILPRSLSQPLFLFTNVYKI